MSRSPRVLHVSPLPFGRAGVVGGGERYAYELARAMSLHTPTRMIAFGHQHAERVGELETRVYQPFAYVGKKQLGPVSPALALEIARADVVHCHQLHTFLADQCVLLGRAMGKRVFLTDHAGGDRNFNRRLRTVERATGLLLVSHFNALGFARFAGKITVIHGGVDPGVFRPVPVERRRVALYVGRLIPYKGVHHLLEGVRPETEVHVAGVGYHAEFEAYLEKVAAGRNARFLGSLLGEDLIREFSAAGVSVLPSVEQDLYGKRYPKSEILGLVLLEAMACETPVVCTNIGGMPELVADGDTGLIVPPADSAALGAAVERLLDNPQEARRLGRAGRERVLRHFTWEAVAQRCLGAYRGASADAPSEVVPVPAGRAS